MSTYTTGYAQHGWRWVGSFTLLLCLALSACGESRQTLSVLPTPALNPALAQMSVYISSYAPGIA